MSSKSYVFDFETFGENFYNKYGYTKIYLWNACDMKTYKHKHGTDIESFFDFILREGVSGFFHNLAFDIEFILYGLNNMGYKCVTHMSDLKPKTYYIMKNGMAIYKLCICSNIKITGKKKKRTKKIITTIKDSLKLLNFKVEELSTAFGLNIHKTFDSDYYDTYRDLDYQITDVDIKGCEADCEVVARCLNHLIDFGLTKMTSASSAFAEWKKCLQQSGYEYSHLFPKIPFNMDKYMRKGYFGGICQCKKGTENKVYHNVYEYDVNSLYPYIYSNRYLPYGTPIFFVGKYKEDKEYPLYIQRVRVELEKKEGYVPVIQKNKTGMFSMTPEYIEDSNGLIIELTLTNIDLELLMNQYNVVYIEYLDGYKFKCKNDMFTLFTNKYMEMKIKASKDNNKVFRQIAKIVLNSNYGKFAMGLVIELTSIEEEEGILKFKRVGEELTEGIYLPMAMFITAYAREYLVNAIQSNYENFLYTDTDSIKLTKPAKNIKIDIENSGELGLWELECISTYFKAIQPKRYMHYNTKKQKAELKCAGMTKKIQERLIENNDIHRLVEKFNIGYKDVQLKKKRVVGGCILCVSDFELKKR